MTPRSIRRAILGTPPSGVMVLALLGVALFGIPLVSLLIAAPWGELGGLLASQVVIDALRLSLTSSVAATGLAVLFGVPLAFVLARVEFWGVSVVRSLVLLPLVLPPVVGGAALLFALGRSGVLGEPLFTASGLVLPFSIWGVIIANTFVAMPFLVISVEGALRSLDRSFEAAAFSLGASKWSVLLRVTLPMIYSSLLSGVLLTWARAFGEFGATLTFAGSLPGRTQTLPLAIFVALEGDRDLAIALSMLMVAVAMGVLLVLRERWWGRA